MEKVVYILWQPPAEDLADWCAKLRGRVSEQILATGAQGLQVNVSDNDVATAMLRLTSFDTPIMAVVSVWVDTVAGSMRSTVEQLLDSASAVLAGYLVTESVPMAVPPRSLGARAEGFSNFAFLRRPDEFAPDAWLDRWQNHHTKVAIETQDTFGYVQNVVVRAVTPNAPPIDGIVEELFRAEALGDVHAFYGSGGDNAELARRLHLMMDSVATFGGERILDVVPTSRYVLRAPGMSEHER